MNGVRFLSCGGEMADDDDDDVWMGVERVRGMWRHRQTDRQTDRRTDRHGCAGTVAYDFSSERGAICSIHVLAADMAIRLRGTIY